MTLGKYRYDLSQPQGNYAWLTKPWVRRSFIAFGVAFVLIGIWLAIERFREEDWGSAGIMIFNLFLGGFNMLMLSHPRFQRRFGQYVEISLREVSWRLPDTDSMIMRRKRLALADVRDAHVELLRIRFVMRDGRIVDLPLGALPYEVVRALKQRFEGEDSFRAAFGGRLGQLSERPGTVSA